MRDLVILRGIPASGKSTWINDNNLKQFTVSSDDLRLLYSGLEYDINGNLRISQSHDKKVWTTLFDILEDRMKKGLFTIVDATHTTEKSIKAYEALCQKYDYSLNIVEFTTDIKEALDRNKKRDSWKVVPDEVIYKMARNMQQPLSSKYQDCIVDKENALYFIERTNINLKDLSKYDEVVVIGDIHSSFEPLKKYFEDKPYSESKFYIFLGDYLDRNFQANDVVNCIADLMYKDNVVLLQGNHENHIKQISYTKDVTDITQEFAKTWEMLTEENRVKAREIGQKVHSFFRFKYKNDYYICTHGGIPTINIDYKIPTRQFTHGVGRYEDMQECDKCFEKNSLNNQEINSTVIYSIHGHRNVENVDICNTSRTFNLCDTVEQGGYLRILTIDAYGQHPTKIKNDTYIQKSDALYSQDIVCKLHESKWVREKELNDGIVSFNFSREAFYKNHFDDISVLARGLFVDSKTGTIIARSYNKFFNIWLEETEKENEREYGDCSIYSLKDKLSFPVTLYKKENGYLGIVSWNTNKDEFFIASKSTNLGEYALHFKEMFMEYYNKQSPSIQQHIQSIVRSGHSLIFEVIDEKFDPHIIKNEISKQFILLDVIQNDFSETYLSYKTISNLAKAWNIPCKQKVFECSDWNDLLSTLRMYNVYDYKNSKYQGIEGFVVEDSKGFKFKFKTAFYRFWKTYRNHLQNYAKGNKVDFTKEENEINNTISVFDLHNTRLYNILSLRETWFNHITKEYKE